MFVHDAELEDVGCINSVLRSCGCFVFVDQPADQVAAANVDRSRNGLGSHRIDRWRVRRLQAQGSVWPLLVVGG
jgi:hypothetical protein